MSRKEQPLIDYINRIVELSEEEEQILLSGIKTRRYLKGQYILQQGDVCSISAFMLKGCTKTFYLDDQGQEHVIMFSIEDWWTSDLASFTTQTPSDFNVQCLENTEVVLFPFETHDQLLEEVPILERFFRKIIERALVASQKRVVRNLSMSARDRYLHFRKQYPLIEQRVPQYLIASYLGITKEFLSKIKSQLIQEQ
jgi:CRP-like cAMP-binding protein